MGSFDFTQYMLASLFQKVNYVILENSPSLLFYLLVWGYETRWGWILRRKSIIFQGFFLRLGLWKGSRERKAAFLHPLTQRSDCCWPRTQKTLEFQVFIHPNVPVPGLFLKIRVLVFQWKLVTPVHSVPFYLALSHKPDFQHTWKSSLWPYKRWISKCCHKGPLAFMPHSKLTDSRTKPLFLFLGIFTSSAAIT